MPKADRNPFFGLRTPWSEVGLVLPARLVTPAVLLVLLAGFAAAIVGSYVIYRQELGKQ